MKLFKKKNLSLIMPINGNIQSIGETPDQMFSQKLMGDGICVFPTDGKVVSPIEGTVTMVFPTKHAIGLKTEDEVEILIHFGIDTVELKGEAFELFVEQGQKVKVGTPLMNGNLQYIKEHGKEDCLILVLVSLGKYTSFHVDKGNHEIGQNVLVLEK